MQSFLPAAPQVEKAIVEFGVILLKYWLEVSPEEQTRRLEARINDGRKIWKLSPMDLRSYSRWDDYSKARDEMFQSTDTAWAPWFVARSDDKRQARLNIITGLLQHIPYQEVPRQKVKLLKRQTSVSYKEIQLSVQDGGRDTVAVARQFDSAVMNGPSRLSSQA